MTKMKRFKLLILLYCSIALISMYIYGCKVPQVIADKSGAQLWGENCMRCHNAPPATMYNDDQWKTIVTHMQVRANITKTEAEKIMQFLQESN